MAELRQLKIKTGSVKRLKKELAYYGEEVKQEQEKLDKLRAEATESTNLQQAVMRWVGVLGKGVLLLGLSGGESVCGVL